MTLPSTSTQRASSLDVRCEAGGLIRGARRPVGWSPAGPHPAGPGNQAELWPTAHEDLCYLTGEFRIFQRTDGHRWSLDDLVTAWRAISWWKDAAPKNILDLGSGIGSVLMMLAWKFERAALTGVEAQDLSVDLARRSLSYNGIDGRTRLVPGDLRATDLDIEDCAFDLITGTPPYFDTSDGIVSDMPQKGPCRFEVRGGVEGYFQAASRYLTGDGTFTVCEDARQSTRVEAAARAHEFVIVDRLDAVGREGKDPLFSVFRCARGTTARDYNVETLTVRDRDGQWTPTFLKVRATMGLPPRFTSGAADRRP